jgi:hypothetical protein
LEQYVVDSLAKGESRFGWGWVDLLTLQGKPWAKMDEDERTCWQGSQFLLGVKPGDWIVHINIPSAGKCTAAQVAGEYRFSLDPQIGDFGHCFPIDPTTTIPFDRNDERIHPRVSRSLKPRQRYQRVYYVEEFIESIARIKAGAPQLVPGDSKGKFFLRKEMGAPLQAITKLIHRNHPSKELEYLVCEIFENIQGVTSAKVNGSGWGTDYGADVIVRYQTGLPLPELRREEVLVVQVKSYDWAIHGTLAIEQLKTAIEQFKANAGILICTAEPTTAFRTEFAAFAEELRKATAPVNVSLIAGQDVARFVIRFGNELLFDE